MDVQARFNFELGYAEAMGDVVEHIQRMTSQKMNDQKFMELINDIIQMRHEAMVELMTHDKQNQGGI